MRTFSNHGVTIDTGGSRWVPRAGGVGGAVDGLVIEILDGIRHFTGLFLGISKSTVEISAGSRGLWHISAPLESGLSEVNAQK